MPSASGTPAAALMEERRILSAVGTASAALSLAGSAFIVVCFLLFKELHKFSFRLVFFLAISDMCWSFFSLVGDPSTEFFCFAHDYSAHFFCVASFLWTTTIAFTLHRTVVQHKTDVEDFGSVFHLYVWGTSLAMTILRSIGSDYGKLGAWCVLQAANTGKIAHLITFYGPLWGAVFYNGFTYFQVNRRIKDAARMAVGMSERSNQYDMRADKAYGRWSYYPLILVASWSFGTINRLHDFLYPGHKIFWLSVLDIGISGLMGLFNSIAYGLNTSMRRAIMERIEMLIPERFRRGLLSWSKPKTQQHESEIVNLIVDGQR